MVQYLIGCFQYPALVAQAPSQHEAYVEEDEASYKSIEDKSLPDDKVSAQGSHLFNFQFVVLVHQGYHAENPWLMTGVPLDGDVEKQGEDEEGREVQKESEDCRLHPL